MPDQRTDDIRHLFAFGSNGSGQLLLDHDEDVSEPALCLTFMNTHSDVQVICGGNHTCLLLDSNYCLLVGNDEPQDLPGEAQPYELPNTIRIPGVNACAATWDAFAVSLPDPVTGGHLIKTFGSSDKGQLGRPSKQVLPSGNEFVDNLNIIAPLAKVKKIAAGVQHFVAILETGEVIGWGNGRKGQLGSPAGIVEKPRRIDGIDFEVNHVVCGREFTYLLGDSVEGRHLVLGSDKWGIRSDAPARIKSWKQAGAGWGSISVLFEDGSVVSWGRNDRGQLAPEGLPSIDKIAVGSEHTLAQTQTGEILVWGWGEHGNCGANVDQQGDVKGRWNVIHVPGLSPGEKVLGVGAGCATSWAWTGWTLSG